MAKSNGSKRIKANNTVYAKATHVIKFVNNGRHVYAPSYKTVWLYGTVLKVELKLVNGKQRITYMTGMCVNSGTRTKEKELKLNHLG